DIPRNRRFPKMTIQAIAQDRPAGQPYPGCGCPAKPTVRERAGAWLARRRLCQVASHLPVVRAALPKWEAAVIAFGAALVLEPSPAGEIILAVMAVYLLVHRRQFMRVLWAVASMEAHAAAVAR